MGAVVGRFAPSPTGDLHLGSARTALAAWLSARSQNGRFVMRIEDIDTPRVVPGAEAKMLADLRWLGLDWDEGPDVGGPNGPYRQSERTDLYARAITELRERGFAFPCTCSRKEIAAQSVASAPHGPTDEGPRYPGTCRERPSHPERPPAWRFRVRDTMPGFRDAVFGEAPGSDPSGDFVVMRADGIFAYQLAVVVDDAAMGVTEVVRGADLLSSTSRQIALLEALGKPVPSYAHLPLILGADGDRLAKRHKSAAISALRERGEDPARLRGWLLQSLGLLHEATPVSPAEALARFDFAKVSREPLRLLT